MTASGGRGRRSAGAAMGALRRLFTGLELPVPKVPPALWPRLRCDDPAALRDAARTGILHRPWSLAPARFPLYPHEIDLHVKGSVHVGGHGYATVGYGGGDVPALHFHVVADGVRLFLQLAWLPGQPLNELEHAYTLSCLSLANRLHAAAGDARARGRLQPGDDLLVVASNVLGSRFEVAGSAMPVTSAPKGRASPADVLGSAHRWLASDPWSSDAVERDLCADDD